MADGFASVNAMGQNGTTGGTVDGGKEVTFESPAGDKPWLLWLDREKLN